jgi:hypothetical protein
VAITKPPLAEVSFTARLSRSLKYPSPCFAKISGEGFTGYVHAMDKLIEKLK